MAEQVTLPRSLYVPEAVEAALDAYRELAQLSAEVTDDAVVVTMSEPDPDLADVLLDELCNHALYETILRSRGGAGDQAG